MQLDFFFLKTRNNQKFDNNSQTAEVFEKLDSSASASEKWIAKYQNRIISVLIIVAFSVLAFIAHDRYIQQPKEKLAMTEMSQAQFYFDQAITAGNNSDSLYNLAINGGQGKYGFLDIIDNYGGTKAGNLAHYYAGMAYLNTNKYQEAIDQLEDFTLDDEILAPLAKGAIGDAFMQLEQPEEALSYYEKAASMRKNDFTTPRFLLKASITAIELGDNDKAVSLLNEIKEKYSTSAEAKNVDLYLGMAKASK